MTIAGTLVDDYHPYPRLGRANQVTTIRAILLALIVGLVGEQATPYVSAAVTAGAVAFAALDGIDGWLARRTRMASAFGARFDVEVDALFMMAMSVLIWRHGKTGPWVLVGGMLRYLFVAAGFLLPWMARPLEPTRRGKTIAACHMLGLTIALAPVVSSTPAAMAVGATTAALVWSFVVDVRRLWRRE
jgi:phosphatidylglycerophosphate synthase